MPIYQISTALHFLIILSLKTLDWYKIIIKKMLKPLEQTGASSSSPSLDPLRSVKPSRWDSSWSYHTSSSSSWRMSRVARTYSWPAFRKASVFCSSLLRAAWTSRSQDRTRAELRMASGSTCGQDRVNEWDKCAYLGLNYIFFKKQNQISSKQTAELTLKT